MNNLPFKKMKGEFGNLGFTNHSYWVKFELDNQLKKNITYYLQTAEPITDNVNLYLFNQHGQVQLQRSGDNIDFKHKANLFRRTIFKIDLNPLEKKYAYIELKNDGEKNTLPLILRSSESQLRNVYHEQMLMGLFYGILFTVVITHLFFFIALKDLIFLYYTLYVMCVVLCHAALDGFFHQYLVQDNNWLNRHAVIIFAIGGSYFFGKYSEIILGIKNKNAFLHYCFKVLYFLLGIVLLAIVLFPVFLSYSYPIVNILTLAGMALIVFSVIILLIKRQPVDLFYLSGISILFVCFTIVILLNFGVSYHSIFLDNITKAGIALEVVALSLAMANQIRLLKSKKDELQALALQRAYEMNETKSHFLSNMSHELRTPLNAIIGFSHLMDSEITDPKMRLNFELIKQASSTLMSSVNDIIDFSKIERNELYLDQIEFSPLTVISSVKERFAKLIEDKGLLFKFSSSFDQDLFVIGDAARLDQILSNLLSNAVKFTLKGTVFFNVEVKILVDGDLELCVEIIDTGEGIPANKLETVFNMFTQLEVDNKRRFGGFGIGLCVVKALVDLHQGDIKLQSVLHEGTNCKVILRYPLAVVKQTFVNKFPMDNYDLLDHHILVVEDNPMNQMVLKMMLKKWKNTRVSFALEGAESLEMIRKHDIDLVLMDLQMPVMDGYEAIAAIRNGDAGLENANLPVIAITADLMMNAKDSVLALGANDFMTKPVDKDILYEKITAQLSSV